MAKIKIEITEDMIKLISNIRFQQMEETSNPEESPDKFYIDLYSLYGGNFLLEDLAFILGKYDERIEGTENNWQGPVFPKEVEDYLFNTHFAVYKNLSNIEEILHQFAGKGGIKPGIYECKPYEHIWAFKKSTT